MKKLIIASLSLLVLNTLCFGQEKKDRHLFPPKAKDNKEIVNKDKVAVKPDTVSVPAAQVDTLKGNASETNSEESMQIQKLNDTIVAYQDTIATLRSAIKAKEEEYNKLLEDLDFADQCMMTLAYRRCKDQFDKDKVEEAITYFDKLHKKETKEVWAGVRQALIDYESCYSEIHRILDQAQNDPDRNNPFVVSEFSDKYRKQLKGTKYYRNYMEKKVEDTIEYLDGIMSEAFNLLSQHYSDQITPADFSKLL